ncbi:MAG: GNAT family N-acetyltransferase [Acidimicrobiales bacterium]|jgi:putative acetyltransferase
MTTVRPSRPDDAAGILAVVSDAFTDDTRDATEELEIVRRTWRACAQPNRIELVAVADGAVAGHVLAAPGRVDGRASAIAGVAPVCVAPAHQNGGTGSALVRELIRCAEDRDWPLLVLLGDPAYYGRFGFTPADRLGLGWAPVGAGNPHFQALALRDATTVGRGTFSYCWE